jgi:4a-hydroxytetrahydrobiopterin dehydratase
VPVQPVCCRRGQTTGIGPRSACAPGSKLSRVSLLTEEEIATALAALAGWTRVGGSITRTLELAGFRDAMLITGAVAYLAEQANHHPDILIRWNKVTLTLSTHSAGGLTAADMSLARQIDALRPP